jgi:hypothetical protein
MKINTAKWDRILRAIFGVILIGAATMYYPTLGILVSIIAAIIGIVMLVVAITGYCWIYEIIGFKTLKDKDKTIKKKK